jgi:drug/metabolite transporter (DMT)-like permease
LIGRPTADSTGRGVTARASALVAFAACCFGSISVLTLVATRAGSSLPNLLFWRYALGAVGLALLAAARGRGAEGEARPTSAQAARLVVLGGAGQAAVAALSLSSLRWISAATLGFLFYTFPAWVMLFAALRRTEPVDGRRAVALALSLGGIALMIGLPVAGGGELAWPGVLLALAAAVTYALYIPLLGRIRTAAGPVVGSAYITAGAALLLGAWAVVDGTLAARMPATAWGAALTLALACTVLAFVAFLSGLGVLGPVRTAIVSTVEPFWTALLGAAVLAQPLTLPALAGGALIAGAVLLLQLPPRGTASAPAAG